MQKKTYSLAWGNFSCRPARSPLSHCPTTLATSHNTSCRRCASLRCAQISSQKRKTGVIAPKRFVARLKKDNELFRSFMHQDAHEFLNFLLNSCCDILEKARPPLYP